MSTDVASPPSRPRRWPKPVDAAQLIPEEGVQVPKAVAGPAAEARAAVAELLSAKGALEEARAYHKEWPELGVDALKEATERAAAAEGAARVALEEQAEAIIGIQEEWLDGAQAAVASREARITALSETIRGEFAQLCKEVHLTEAIEQFTGKPWHWESRIEDRPERARQRRKRNLEQAAKDVKFAITSRRQEVRFSVDHLTVGLAELAKVVGRVGSGW